MNPPLMSPSVNAPTPSGAGVPSARCGPCVLESLDVLSDEDSPADDSPVNDLPVEVVCWSGFKMPGPEGLPHMGVPQQTCNQGSSRVPSPLDDVHDRVLAEAELPGDEPVRASLCPQAKHLGTEAIGLGPLSGLPSEGLAIGFRRSDA